MVNVGTVPPATRMSRSALSVKLLSAVTRSWKTEVLMAIPVPVTMPSALMVNVALPGMGRASCIPCMETVAKVSTGLNGAGKSCRWASVATIVVASSVYTPDASVCPCPPGAVAVGVSAGIVGVDMGVAVTVSVASTVGVNGVAEATGVTLTVAVGAGCPCGVGVGQFPKGHQGKGQPQGVGHGSNEAAASTWSGMGRSRQAAPTMDSKMIHNRASRERMKFRLFIPLSSQAQLCVTESDRPGKVMLLTSK